MVCWGSITAQFGGRCDLLRAISILTNHSVLSDQRQRGGECLVVSMEKPWLLAAWSDPPRRTTPGGCEGPAWRGLFAKAGISAQSQRASNAIAAVVLVLLGLPSHSAA